MLCFRFKKLANFNKCFGSVRWASSVKREFKEVEIKVPWGHVAGKWWEPYDTRPILAIHGWQENCQSFDRLIPMLDKNVGFLAIDLPGHGYSSRLPVGMMYHYSVYILTIKSIAKSFKWLTISLMGHSMGCVMAYLYSMIYPIEVDFLICIEALKPKVYSTVHADMAIAYDKCIKYNNFIVNSKEPPNYTIEEMITLICTPNNNSVLPEYAKYLMERNIASSESESGKYYFTRDVRVKTGRMLNFCQDELVQLAENMIMPIFIVKAKNSSYYEPKQNYYEVLDVLKRISADCDFHYVEGTHHVHLNSPENISDLLNNFIERHRKPLFASK